MPNRFPQIVRQEEGVPLIFEIMPPRRDSQEEKVVAWRDQVVAAVETLPIAAVNIPEVRDEVREGERTYTYVKRMKPREFGKRLCDAFSKPIDLIINRVVVYRSIDQQKEWLENSYRDFGIRNVVLVGGELEPDAYLGPSVTTMAKLISEEINYHLPAGEKWFCGGIAIATRRSVEPLIDEPFRMLQKARNGIDFFTTQIIYESYTLCRLLADYSGLCLKEGDDPKRIFISLAPVQKEKHIEFIRWLGVDVPPGVEGEILEDTPKAGSRSLDVCCRIFQKILEFNSKLDRPVPLGVNISPLMVSNFDLGVELVDRLSLFSWE